MPLTHLRGEVRRQDRSEDSRDEHQYENHIEQLGIDQTLPRRVERVEGDERCRKGRGHLRQGYEGDIDHGRAERQFANGTSGSSPLSSGGESGKGRGVLRSNGTSAFHQPGWT